MRNSIITDDLEHCIVCGNNDVEIHHCFYGTANRALSEKYKLLVPLCPYHHRDSKAGVHFNPELDATLKRKGREAFEREYQIDFDRTFVAGK